MQTLRPAAVPLSQRTSEGVARILRGEIFAGRLQPGEPLPERLLAEQLGVSRTPVREALFTLHSEGLIELAPNRGAAVRTVTSQDIFQIYSLRQVLESYAAREASQARTRQDLNAIENAHARLERVGTEGDALEHALADLAFHTRISEAAGNQMLQTMISQVLAFTVSYRSSIVYPSERRALVNAQHRAIIDALRDRDADRAELLMRQHVECSSRFAVEHFGETEGVCCTDR